MYAVLILFSIPLIANRFQEVSAENITGLLGSESLPSISIIIPAHNEEKLIINTIYNALGLEYVSKNIIVVNDGSTDQTMEYIKKEFQLEEVPLIKPLTIPCANIKKVYQSKIMQQLIVIDKEKAGRPDAVNAGINISLSNLVLVIDADTVIEKDALLRMVRPFLTNPNIVGQGATLRILNGCQLSGGKITGVGLPNTLVEGIQVVEYLRAFLYGRLGWNAFCGPVIISGAFGLFDRKKVIDRGGYDITSIGEDFDLTMNLLQHEIRQGNKSPISFVPDPIAWTDIPTTYKELGKQRARWHQGLCQVLYKYKYMCFNPKYGSAGMIAYPYMLFGELLEPFFELVGYGVIFLGIPLGYLHWSYGVVFLLVAFGITAILTTISVIMEISTFRRYNKISQLLKLAAFAFLENFGYRQRYLWWRFVGFWRYFTNSKQW